MLPLLCAAAIALASPTPARPAPVPVPQDPVLQRHLQGKTVLVLGDSMIVTGLVIWLGAVVRAHGGTLKRWAWASSTTESWATGKVLDLALRRHRPDIVIIVLGSNELYLDKPADRARHVRTILARLGKRPYRWLGPPVWGRQTGIVDVIRQNVPASRFYPFNGRHIARNKDGKHPSPWGARTWTYDFARWWIARLKAEGR